MSAPSSGTATRPTGRSSTARSLTLSVPLARTLSCSSVAALVVELALDRAAPLIRALEVSVMRGAIRGRGDSTRAAALTAPRTALGMARTLETALEAPTVQPRTALGMARTLGTALVAPTVQSRTALGMARTLGTALVEAPTVQSRRSNPLGTALVAAPTVQSRRFNLNQSRLPSFSRRRLPR